jgi:hypothetical protein
MGYAKIALTLLRVGIGLYMVFTALTRVFSLDAPISYTTMFGMLGMAAPNVSAVNIGVSIFLGVLGLVLLWGRALVVAGVVVAIVGLWNGVAEMIASQAPNMPGLNRIGLLTLGLRDVLVLGSTGAAIAALDAYVRRSRVALTKTPVTMYREGRTPVTTGRPTVERVDTDLPPTTRP